MAFGVGPGRLDRLPGRIDSQHLVAEPGQCLGRQAGAAADVQDAGPLAKVSGQQTSVRSRADVRTRHGGRRPAIHALRS